MATSCSRREALFAAAGVAAIAFTPEAQAKIAQKAVAYQDKPKDGHQCSGCAHFHAPATCDVVDGTITPSGWCKLFTQKVSD